MNDNNWFYDSDWLRLAPPYIVRQGHYIPSYMWYRTVKTFFSALQVASYAKDFIHRLKCSTVRQGPPYIISENCDAPDNSSRT